MKEIAIACRILGACFRYAPNEVELRPIFDAFEQKSLEEEWPYGSEEDIQAISRQMQLGLASRESLSEAYARLFIGPTALPAPPWGSVYLDRENVIFGDSMLVWRQFLRDANVQIELQMNEPEDHIGLMLFVLAYFAENGDAQHFDEALSEHILIWAYRYLDLLETHADNDFYQALARLTRITLTDLQAARKLRVPARLLHFPATPASAVHGPS